MKHSFVVRWLLAFIDPFRAISIVKLPKYIADFVRLRKMGLELRICDTYPHLMDSTKGTPFDPHYFFQAAWITRELAATRPHHHVDIGSAVYLPAVISAFIPCTFIDFRKLEVDLPNLTSLSGDLCKLEFSDRTVNSLSCLHVIEHIGLGRYGDMLDPNGSSKAAAELARVLSPTGKLYISVPIGIPRIEFNAHRIFDPSLFLDMFRPMRLLSFSYVDDNRVFHKDARPIDASRERYACGMYVFTHES